MDYRQAYQFFMANRSKFAGMSPTDAVAQIMRGGAAQPAAVATPAAQPVPTSAIATAIPEQAEEAPAEPQPQPYLRPEEVAYNAYKAANPAAPAPAAGGKVDYAAKARQATLDAVGNELKAAAEIARTGGQLDPKLQGVIDDRLARYGQDLMDIDKDRKQAVWMSIAQAGMKMAQSQSPYFMQALASGMEAGLGGFSEAKAKAAEKKARLQEAKEELVIKQAELMNQAIRDAQAARLAAVQGAAAKQELESGALESLVAGETADEKIAEAGLRNTLINEQILTARQSRTLAAAADRRARAAGGNPLASAYNAGIASEADYGRKFAETAMEESDLRPGDPGYTAAYQRAVSEGRSIFRNSNPQWAGVANRVEGVTTIARPAPARAAPRKPKETMWQRINPFD